MNPYLPLSPPCAARRTRRDEPATAASVAASRTAEPQPCQKPENAVPSLEVQRWPEGFPFSTPGRHRWHAVLEQPVGRVHLAGDYLGARGAMDTAAVVGYETAHRITTALSH